jgi:hypothetical protein
MFQVLVKEGTMRKEKWITDKGAIKHACTAAL